jgi:hypothetical protein
MCELEAMIHGGDRPLSGPKLRASLPQYNSYDISLLGANGAFSPCQTSLRCPNITTASGVRSLLASSLSDHQYTGGSQPGIGFSGLGELLPT